MRTIRDTWLIFQRSMTLTLRNPVWLIMGLMQPILYLLLFGPLLKSIATMPGFPPGGAFNVFVPGILVMTALFSSRQHGGAGRRGGDRRSEGVQPRGRVGGGPGRSPRGTRHRCHVP